MRRRLTLSLTFGIVLTIGLAALATADGTDSVSACLRSSASDEGDCSPRRLVISFGSTVMPKKLPKHQMAPVAVELFGKVVNTDGTQPSALREVKFSLDGNEAIDAAGLPICRRRQLETRNARAVRRACRESIVGTGMAEVAIPSSRPNPIELPLTLFNGGVRNGTATLFIRSVVPVPAATAAIATVKLSRDRNGRVTRGVAKVPRIAAGNGSLLGFQLEIERRLEYGGEQVGYATARCPDGNLAVEFSSLLFKNEARVPSVAAQTILKGIMSVPCKPKR